MCIRDRYRPALFVLFDLVILTVVGLAGGAGEAQVRPRDAAACRPDGRAADHAPVSYTHLDVYKRQGYGRTRTGGGSWCSSTTSASIPPVPGNMTLSLIHI